MDPSDESGLAALAADQTVFGAKIAVICGDRLIAYQRDDIPTIPNPGEWDLPGGVREHGETALHCALRETEEEFGIRLSEGHVVHAARYHKFQPQRIEAVFFAARVPQAMIDRIVFGDEGQRWEMMAVQDFVAHRTAVSELQRLTSTWWRQMTGSD